MQNSINTDIEKMISRRTTVRKSTADNYLSEELYELGAEFEQFEDAISAIIERCRGMERGMPHGAEFSELEDAISKIESEFRNYRDWAERYKNDLIQAMDSCGL